MNQRFYHSLMLSRSFFHTFDHIRYRGVPVARAMFYSFHRKSQRWKGGGVPRKNWHRHKKKFYSQLVKTEPIVKVNYDRKPTGSFLFTPESAAGLTHTSNESIICGVHLKDRSKFSASQARFVLPEQTPLNRRAFTLIHRAFIKKIRSKRCSVYFKRKPFIRWLQTELPKIMQTIDGCLRLFNRNPIKGVIVHSSVHSLGYVLTHMGKQRNIPTITLQYGINDDYQLMSTYSHYYVAWGETHKKRLTQFGVPATKITTIGTARFDAIYHGKWFTKAQLARALKISPLKKFFFYPEQPLARAINRKALMTITRALYPYRKQVVLLVKPHPKQKKMSLTSKETRHYSFVKYLNRHKLPLYHFISGSSAVFVQFSTVGIETLLLNRPLVAIALFPNTVKHEFSYYAASRLITSARNQKQLRRIISRLMRNPSYSRTVLRKQKKYRNLTYAGTLSKNRIQQFINEKCDQI